MTRITVDKENLSLNIDGKIYNMDDLVSINYYYERLRIMEFLLEEGLIKEVEEAYKIADSIVKKKDRICSCEYNIIENMFFRK